MTQQVKLYDARLLARYFERRAKASIGLEPSFRLGKAVWGRGFNTLIDGKPSVTDIPMDASQIQDVFAESDPVYSYANGRITIRALLKPGSVPAGEQKEFTALGILDDAGGLVAVLASTPIWIHDKRSLAVEGYIDTNIA